MSDEKEWKPKHLPYQIDPRNRWEYYETLWKHVGLKMLMKHLPPTRGCNVLDYGCGRGEALQIFGSAGYEMMGADLDPACVKISSQHGDATKILNPSAPATQFGEKAFEAVVCFHVLEHVENPKNILTELAKIARQYVLIAVPNLRRIDRISVRDFRLEHVNEGHLQSWDHWHLRNLAECYCGLKLVEWGSDATPLPLLSAMSQKVLGSKATIFLETEIFRRIFPYHCVSVLGLFRVV